MYDAITEPGTIRLIRIEPSPDLDAELRCRLLHKTLDDCSDDIVEPYTALSYIWGDQSDTKTIYANDRSSRITKSLHCALRHIRDKLRLLDVWADGVSINQFDISDRNMQVQQMDRIYATAHHTIIFLRQHSVGSEPVLNQISPRKQLVDHPSPSAHDDFYEGRELTKTLENLQNHVLSVSGGIYDTCWHCC